MGIFEEKRRQAMAVRDGVEQRAIADFDKVIARGTEIDALREKATTAHLVKLDSVAADLQGFHASIEEYANGEPPLKGGEKSDNKLPQAWEPPRS